MINNVMLNFFNYINRLVDKEKLQAYLAYYGAPLFKEDKVSVLVTLTNDLYSAWEKYRDDMLTSEYHYFELNKNQKCINVIIYNKKRMEKLLNAKETKDFINNYGYIDKDGVMEKLHFLSERYKGGCPHEIGIFLGYPIDDVKAFIKDCGKNCLYCGYWKVYHNTENAIERFNAYDKAKETTMISILNNKKHLVPVS